jgi:nitroreductase
MAILKEIKERYSPVLFKAKAVPLSKRKNCLEAARLAPSCSNKQPWKFVLVEGKKRISKLEAVFPRGNQWALAAPIVGFIVSKAEDACISEGNDNLAYFQYDCGMAMMNFVLQAEKEGLKAHQMAGYSEKEAKKLLKVPADYRVIVAFALGYEEKLKDIKREMDPRMVEKVKNLSKSRIRKPLKEVYSMNTF